MVVDTLHAIIVFGGTHLAKLDRCGHPAVRSYLLLRGRFNRMARWLRRNSQEGNPSHALPIEVFCALFLAVAGGVGEPAFSFKVGPTVTLGADCCVPCG